jgi:hypothetical protein
VALGGDSEWMRLSRLTPPTSTFLHVRAPPCAASSLRSICGEAVLERTNKLDMKIVKTPKSENGAATFSTLEEEW